MKIIGGNNGYLREYKNFVQCVKLEGRKPSRVWLQDRETNKSQFLLEFDSIMLSVFFELQTCYFYLPSGR